MASYSYGGMSSKTTISSGRSLLTFIMQLNYNHMKVGILTTLLLFACSSYAQDKKDLAVSLSGGLFNSPYYKNAKAKGFYSFDFDYHLAKRHILSANYLAGKHTYYDDVLSNDPGTYNVDATNADAEYRTFSVLYKYKVVDNSIISLTPGIGVGIMTHTRKYPYSEVNKSYPQISSWSDIVFPVSLDLNFKLSSQWQAGLSSGFLIHPDYPVLALHIGPKLSYVIK
jgi:hypothetical protein